jgi:MtaA/CmuA family methyltransferase
VTLEIAEQYGVDGLRLFTLPEPLRVRAEGEEMIAVDPETDRRVGRIDLWGGGRVIPDEAETVVETPEDVKRIPRLRCEELLEREAFGHLQAATSRAHRLGLFVATAPPGLTVNSLAEYRGRQRALMDLAVEPELAGRVMDRALVNAIEHGKAAVRCGVDALYIGDPLASSSVISPRHFEQFCLPRFRLFCEELRRLDVLIYLHVCGNSGPILEMMADTGVDCIEPLDPLGGVDVADAKRRIGGRVALMGGVNTLTLLGGSPEEVYEEATACCRAGGSDGGYLLAAGDMVPDETAAENVQAMVRAARDYRYG